MLTQFALSGIPTERRKRQRKHKKVQKYAFLVLAFVFAHVLASPRFTGMSSHVCVVCVDQPFFFCLFLFCFVLFVFFFCRIEISLVDNSAPLSPFFSSTSFRSQPSSNFFFGTSLY